MVCVFCGGKTRVTNSRHQRRANRTWRRRECLSCRAVFTSEEGADYGSSWLVKGETGLKAFSRDKLFLSLYKACQHRKTAVSDATGLTDGIIGRLSSQIKDGVVEVGQIRSAVMVALSRFDGAASIAYAAFHRE